MTNLLNDIEDLKNSLRGCQLKNLQIFCKNKKGFQAFGLKPLWAL